eukprot:911190-Rhodomonas_salina.1
MKKTPFHAQSAQRLSFLVSSFHFAACSCVITCMISRVGRGLTRGRVVAMGAARPGESAGS